MRLTWRHVLLGGAAVLVGFALGNMGGGAGRVEPVRALYSSGHYAVA